MNTVPNVISTKDLSYLSDLFQWNLTSAKIAHHYYKECQIEDIKKMMEVVYGMHRRHAWMILTLLKEGQHE